MKGALSLAIGLLAAWAMVGFAADGASPAQWGTPARVSAIIITLFTALATRIAIALHDIVKDMK